MRKLDLIALGLLGAGPAIYAGCDGDNTQSDADTDGDTTGNHAPTPIDGSSVTPADGSVYDIGDLVPLAFTVPTDEDGDSLNGTLIVTGDSDAVAGPSAGDYTNEIALGSLTPGARLTHDIDTATAGPSGAALPTRADGTQTPYTLEILVTDGRGGEARAERNVTVTGVDPNKPRVTGCYVSSANIGNTLVTSCYAVDPNDPTGSSLIGNWGLTTDLSRATISDVAPGSAQILASTLGAADVGLHNYSVTASNGTYTSASFDFEVPVDEHASYLRLNCNDGTNHRLLLPETSVDAVSEACFTGYNASLKPSHSGEPSYVGDVVPDCARTALEALPAAEREAHRSYNGGPSGDKTPASVFSGCTVDFAQVEYHSGA